MKDKNDKVFAKIITKIFLVYLPIICGILYCIKIKDMICTGDQLILWNMIISAIIMLAFGITMIIVIKKYKFDGKD